MNIPPLYLITLDRLEGGFIERVYFTFTVPSNGYSINETTFRARIQGTVGQGENLMKIAKRGESAKTVADRLRQFNASGKLKAHVLSVADQIEKGAGPDTRRYDALFED